MLTAAEKTRRWKERHPDRAALTAAKSCEKAKQRYHSDPDYRAKVIAQVKKRYEAKKLESPKFLEERNKWHREYVSKRKRSDVEFKLRYQEYQRNYRRERRLVDPEWDERLRKHVSDGTRKRRSNPEKRAEDYIHIRRRRKLMATAPGQHTLVQWLARVNFYGKSCAYCGSAITLDKTTMDHVKPLKAGGSNWPANLAPACKKCNLRKALRRWIPRQPRPHSPLPD